MAEGGGNSKDRRKFRRLVDQVRESIEKNPTVDFGQKGELVPRIVSSNTPAAPKESKSNQSDHLGLGDSVTVFSLVLALLTWAFVPSFFAKSGAVFVSIAILWYLSYRSYFVRKIPHKIKHLVSSFLISIVSGPALLQLVPQWNQQHSNSKETIDRSSNQKPTQIAGNKDKATSPPAENLSLDRFQESNQGKPLRTDRREVGSVEIYFGNDAMMRGKAVSVSTQQDKQKIYGEGASGGFLPSFLTSVLGDKQFVVPFLIHLRNTSSVTIKNVAVVISTNHPPMAVRSGWRMLENGDMEYDLHEIQPYAQSEDEPQIAADLDTKYGAFTPTVLIVTVSARNLPKHSEAILAAFQQIRQP